MTNETSPQMAVTVEQCDLEARIAAARKKLNEEAPALSRAAWDFVFNGRRKDDRG